VLAGRQGGLELVGEARDALVVGLAGGRRLDIDLDHALGEEAADAALVGIALGDDQGIRAELGLDLRQDLLQGAPAIGLQVGHDTTPIVSTLTPGAISL
jgi:hypothetical protein